MKSKAPVEVSEKRLTKPEPAPVSEKPERKLATVPTAAGGLPQMDEGFLTRLRELDESHRAKHGRGIPQKKALELVGGRMETIVVGLRAVREQQAA